MFFQFFSGKIFEIHFRSASRDLQSKDDTKYTRFGCYNVETCESFFHSNRISNRIGRPIRFRIESLNRIGRCNQTTVVYTLNLQQIFSPSVFCICDEREWCTDYGAPSTCLFQFSHKTRQTMLLYAYFTPKVDFKRKFNHHQSFLYEWRLTARRFENFESDHQYESNLESDVRLEVESNHEASQVPITMSRPHVAEAEDLQLPLCLCAIWGHIARLAAGGVCFGKLISPEDPERPIVYDR